MRLLALINKELLAIFLDKKSLFVVIVPPLLQILIFSFSITTEVKNINLALYNLDSSVKSKNLIEHFARSPHITLKKVNNYEEGKESIEHQKALAFIVIPNDFEKTNSEIQLILDGRHSNTSQIAESYLNSIIQNFQKNKLPNTINIIPRNFYNFNLNNFWWIVPNLFGSITTIVAIILTALSIARERELGTFDQILVSPLSPFEILLGKLLPSVFIALAESTVILLFMKFLFHIPFNGSLLLLYFAVTIFLFTTCGVGLFISALCSTQQQAILGAFIFLLPSFLLSGFVTPVENMPTWLQPISNFIPLKYYIVIIKGIFLKNISFAIVMNNLIPLILLGIVSLTSATVLFKSKTS